MRMISRVLSIGLPNLSPEYYIANVNPECWSQYKARMPIDCIQPYLITNMSSNARRALTLHTRSHKLGIEIASWYQNVTNFKTCKVCNQGIVVTPERERERERERDKRGNGNDIILYEKTRLQRVGLRAKD